MSLSKRIVYDASSLGSQEVYEDSKPRSMLVDINMSKILGAFNQLIYLTSYTAETFDDLTQLMDETSERIESASNRIKTLFKELPKVEKAIHSAYLRGQGHSGRAAKLKYFKDRESYLPATLLKQSNANQIVERYDLCHPPPALWKIGPILGEDVMIYFSHPGFFFQEWLRSEESRQEVARLERKKSKQIRKQLKVNRNENKPQPSNSSSIYNKLRGNPTNSIVYDEFRENDNKANLFSEIEKIKASRKAAVNFGFTYSGNVEPETYYRAEQAYGGYGSDGALINRRLHPPPACIYTYIYNNCTSTLILSLYRYNLILILHIYIIFGMHTILGKGVLLCPHQRPLLSMMKFSLVTGVVEWVWG